MVDTVHVLPRSPLPGWWILPSAAMSVGCYNGMHFLPSGNCPPQLTGVTSPGKEHCRSLPKHGPEPRTYRYGTSKSSTLASKDKTLPCDLHLRYKPLNTHLPIHPYIQDQAIARLYLRPILQLFPLPYPASNTPLKVFAEEQSFNKSYTQKSLSQALLLINWT